MRAFCVAITSLVWVSARVCWEGAVLFVPGPNLQNAVPTLPNRLGGSYRRKTFRMPGGTGVLSHVLEPVQTFVPKAPESGLILRYRAPVLDAGFDGRGLCANHHHPQGKKHHGNGEQAPASTAT
jgi:hypothetical protein